MKLLIGKQPLGWTLQWAHRALFACAIVLLGYCGFALADSWVFQRRESRELDRQLRGAGVATDGTPRSESTASRNGAPGAATHGLVGRMAIPRLRFSEVVVEGIGRTTLRRVVGHIPGTALPGQPGNVGLAGHRDTFFRPLKDLRVDDEIRFSTPRGDFQYKVESLRIVDPDDTGVLAASGGNVLTLVTCYPFYYVGPAPKRWIVRARQVSPPALARLAVER
ncbi:MAG: class D sortase [Bryobacteraceae bacterium]|jgi:sortase A